ncbi:MAG: hypothetical protein M1816_003545 [Peltula sp. TS41687]|nr:MAG: hypothetical protein M1816_003545 [Peltula sp. TS41687]
MQNDLLTAARAGQALLVRHEAYIVDSERERRKLVAVIESSQMEKQMADALSANILQENKLLLSQLEELNQSVASSDVHIKSLEATLQSTKQELHRVSSLASRTLQLEAQLNSMECEIAQLQQVVLGAQEQEKVAVQRWKNAERSLQVLQDEVERIEKRSKEERESHSEAVARLQRKHLVHDQSKNTGEALLTQDSPAENWSTDNRNVISHFVRDLLQDNANLQASMVEIRDMLLASHEENERLKEELTLHQPSLVDNKRNLLAAALAEDLHLEPSKPENRERHIRHHQYHDTSNLTPSQAPYRALTPHDRRHLTLSAATVVSQASITIVSKVNARSSIQSAAHSLQRGSLRNDRIFSDGAIKVLPPNGPGSDQATRTTPSLRNRGALPERSLRVSRQAPTSPLTPPANCELDARSAVAEGADSDHVGARLDLSTMAGTQPVVRAVLNNGAGRSLPLGRSSSHESLLSISGMDIHTLRDRPLRPIITGSGLMLRAISQSSSVSAAPISDQPVMGAMATAARPSVNRYDSSTYNRSLLQGNGGARAVEESASAPLGQGRDTLRRKLGDWVWGKWGTSGSTSSSENLRMKAAQSEKLKDHSGKGHGGSEVQSKSSPQPSVKVIATDLNENLLRETLLG